MKQIKHIFVRVTIVLCVINSLALFSQQSAVLTSGSLLEQVIAQVQNPEHKEETLLSLLVTLLDHGVQTHQSPVYAQSVFKLFSNIIKGAHYINATTLSHTLAQFPHHLERYFSTVKNQRYATHHTGDTGLLFDQFKSTVNNMLYIKFSSEYEFFRREPEKFLEHLADNVVRITQTEIEADKLRGTMIRFLELALSKIVWSPEDQEQTWESVKTIAANLGGLFEHTILEDVNDLDDLFWSLIHRYTYFIEITGSSLSVPFFEYIKNDIHQSNLLFLNLEEQDEFIESKRRYLQRVLMQAEVKARAFEKGILI